MSSNGTQDVMELKNEQTELWDYGVDSEGRYYFRCSTGVILYLRRIPEKKFLRFQSAWKQSNPAPVPPQHEIKRARRMVWVDNTNDPYFKMQIDLWQADLGSAILDYASQQAVINDPPKDYQPDEIISGLYQEMTPNLIKCMWIEDQLIAENESDAFFEAIKSIGNATEQGIAESTERFPSTSE